MIIERIIDLLFMPINLLVSMLPKTIVQTASNIQLPQILRWGACFFPLDAALLAIGAFVTWYTIFMTWAIIEWIYKKIPGVS